MIAMVFQHFLVTDDPLNFTRFRTCSRRVIDRQNSIHIHAVGARRAIIQNDVMPPGAHGRIRGHGGNVKSNANTRRPKNPVLVTHRGDEPGVKRIGSFQPACPKGEGEVVLVSENDREVRHDLVVIVAIRGVECESAAETPRDPHGVIEREVVERGVVCRWG